MRDTDQDMKAPAADQTLVETDWLKRWARYSPAAIALKDSESGREYSYGQLYRLACETAQEIFRRFDIKPGDRVAVVATNEIEYVALFYALQRLAAIMVPVNYRLTAREISHILSDSSPELLIAQTVFQPVLEKIDAQLIPEKRWAFDGAESLSSFLQERAQVKTVCLAARPHSWENALLAELESPSMILYTSGTTGAPKGAIVTQKMMFWNSVNTTLRLNLSESDITLSFLPFFHTGGWNVLLTPFLHRGAKTILLKKFEPEQVLELCDKEGVTILFGVPTTMDMMVHTPTFARVNLNSVRYAIVGGEPMPLDLIQTWQAKGVPVRQGYGLSEFGPNVFSLSQEDSIRKIGSIGFQNFYIDVKIIDAGGEEILDERIGELLLRGPVCTPGYWNHAKATAETIQNGWLHTGDLVRRDSEGYFYVAGRKKDMFISGGENVYPVEVEQYLGTHPSIREVAVIGVPDSKWGEVGKAFLALNAGETLSAEEVLQFCAGQLAKYKIPKHVEFLPELPKGDSGKILKRRLREETASI
jgi:fatty-acyl-CoA synthase